MPSDITACALCGDQLRTTAPGVLRSVVSGWAPVNRKAGGANAIRLAKYGDRWAHEVCVELRMKGVSIEQGRLPW